MKFLLSKRGVTIIFKTLCLILLLSAVSVQSDVRPLGELKGKIVSYRTKAAVADAIVKILTTNHAFKTNDMGEFSLKRVPVGKYSVLISHPLFEPIVISDVLIRSQRITYKKIELVEVTYEDEITVGSYFPDKSEEPSSVFSFNSEEIRKSPGSGGGDVSRVINSLPSVAQINDSSNDLMVRGGAPFENAFYIDNIQIISINHFPGYVSTSRGPIGLINSDFIDNVTFYAGGFNAEHGNKLSSVIDITYREGNRDEFDIQFDMSMAGFGGTAEGPLFGGNGSWMFAARKSYLDLIVDVIGTGVAPSYGDIQGKLVFDINATNKLSFLLVYGSSIYKIDEEHAIDKSMPNYIDNQAEQITIGSNWQALWKTGFSNTSVSYSAKTIDFDQFRINPPTLIHTGDTYEAWFNFRNVNLFTLGKSNSLKFGIEAEYLFGDYQYYYTAGISRLGQIQPELNVNKELDISRGGVFASLTTNPIKNISIVLGARYDYSSINEQANFSPRIAASIKITDRLSINGAGGIYYQDLPLFLLSQNEEFASLKTLKAVHYVVGLDYLISSDTKLTLDVYEKRYENFPLSSDFPPGFPVDSEAGGKELGGYSMLIDSGEAVSRGVELLIQKKLKENFYGLISVAYIDSEYRDYNGQWRDRKYDAGWLVTVIGGYRLAKDWELSVRWNYIGGMPYTPFDIDASESVNEGILDMARFNSERTTDYHSLYLRIDKRFFFEKSSLTVYLELWNLYNRDNVAWQYWNSLENKLDEQNQYGFLPVGGIEWEF